MLETQTKGSQPPPPPRGPTRTAVGAPEPGERHLSFTTTTGSYNVDTRVTHVDISGVWSWSVSGG